MSPSQSMKATVVIEFDIDASASEGAALIRVERLIAPMMRFRDPEEVAVQITMARIRSLKIENVRE